MERGMGSAATSHEMKVYTRDVLAEARRLRVKVPRLEGIEQLFA